MSREDFSVLTDSENTKWNDIGLELRNNPEWPESFLDQIPKPSETNENGKRLPDSVVRAAFKKYSEDLPRKRWRQMSCKVSRRKCQVNCLMHT
jgi:hypothetical protein